MSQDRERRLAFLRANTELFSRESPAAYQRSGRGFWLVAEWLQPGMQYHDAGGVEELRGEFQERVSRMVRTYDPSWQCVVVISEEDDSIHAYTVGFVDPSQS